LIELIVKNIWGTTYFRGWCGRYFNVCFIGYYSNWGKL